MCVTIFTYKYLVNRINNVLMVSLASININGSIPSVDLIDFEP